MLSVCACVCVYMRVLPYNVIILVTLLAIVWEINWYFVTAWLCSKSCALTLFKIY